MSAEEERAAIVAYLRSQDEFSPLSGRLAANCEMPDIDLSWVFPFIANAIERKEHLSALDQEGGAK